jgi:hypothetical protein
MFEEGLWPTSSCLPHTSFSLKSQHKDTVSASLASHPLKNIQRTSPKQPLINNSAHSPDIENPFLVGTAQNFAKYHKKLKMLGQSSDGDELVRMQRYRIKCKDKKWNIKIKKGGDDANI